MKKLLFMAALVIGGSYVLRGGYVKVAPDNQVRVAGWTVPLPASVQSSPIMGMVAMLINQAAPPANAGDQRPAAAQYVRPPVPNVTSATNTYSANAPGNGQVQGGDQFGAATKALRGQ
jgi:hypothetical protein